MQIVSCAKTGKGQIQRKARRSGVIDGTSRNTGMLDGIIKAGVTIVHNGKADSDSKSMSRRREAGGGWGGGEGEHATYPSLYAASWPADARMSISMRLSCKVSRNVCFDMFLHTGRGRGRGWKDAHEAGVR